MDKEKHPSAYFLTFTTCGARYHGDERGTVDRTHNEYGSSRIRNNPEYVRLRQNQAKFVPYKLNEKRRQIVLNSIIQTCNHFNWFLYAAHVRTNHVHVLLKADCTPNIALTQIKARSSRELKKIDINPDIKRWTRHGSTKYIWNDAFIWCVIGYIINDQGDKLNYYISNEFETILE